MKLNLRTFSSFLVILACLLFVTGRPLRAQTPDLALQHLDNKITTLEERQQIVVEAMEKTYSNGFWFIGIVVAFTTLLSGLRYIHDQRLVQRLLSDAQELGKSYKTNIETTNQLMSSITNALVFYEGAQKTLADLAEVKAFQAQAAHHSEEQINRLNDLAIKLSPQCRRNSHNDQNIQHQVRDFHDQYQVVELSSQATTKLNANVHFILGFHHRIENNYDEALKEFRTAQESAAIDRNQSSHPAYTTLPHGVSLSAWLTKLINICAYHRALLSNNLGKYGEGKQLFETALEHDNLDYQALSYIPETMFLGGLASFSEVIAKFRNVINTVETLRTDQAKQASFSLDQATLLGLLYLKLANCYMADTPNSDYRAHRNFEEAEGLVRIALKHSPTSLFARLTLAQLLHQLDREPEEKRGLFIEVFAAAKTVMARVTEAKILMMYYYAMLICCGMGAIAGEAPGAYVTRVFELVPRLPKQSEQLRIFSPLSKGDLELTAFMAEVQEFAGGLSLVSPPLQSSPVQRDAHTVRPWSPSVGRSLLDGR